MKDLSGKVAVVTGGGTGMGRALVRQLAAEGCHVATCDVIEENLETTLNLANSEAAQGVQVIGTLTDVAIEREVRAFRDFVANTLEVDHINLLFNNAGIGGGGSFVNSTQEEWERTFDICWYGVYHCSRAFLSLLLSSTEGHIINTSSVNGFRASLGGNIPHTAYSAAKFAVKGFSEALINDFRFNAPHLKVSVVMPGYVGTDIAINTGRILGHKEPKDWSDEDVEKEREFRKKIGTSAGGLFEQLPDISNDEFRANAQAQREAYRDAPVSPEQAARIMIDGVKTEQWRILVGKDAEALDKAVRKDPLSTYDLDFSENVWKSME